jgi:hypothetical protein
VHRGGASGMQTTAPSAASYSPGRYRSCGATGRPAHRRTSI